MEIQQNKFLSVEKPRVNRRQAAKERKLALLQDVYFISILYIHNIYFFLIFFAFKLAG